MDLLAYAGDWLHLIVRWLHVTAAIAWVGASFYFIALDQSLRAPRREGAEGEGVGGEAWEIHGGGFYRVEKYRIAPSTLPAPLAWFKWEAYTTWLSGFVLLVLLYYVDPSQYLMDPNRPRFQGWELVTASVAILAFSWLAYDVLSRALAGPQHERALAIGIVLLIVLVAALSGYLFSPRGAFIQIGATLGTWMAANVFFTIIPGQRALVAATAAGREPDPGPGIRGKQRSVHNNYLTLPVLFAMISQHFPFTYGHDNSWLGLLGFMALGAVVRHVFNLRHQGRDIRRTLVAVIGVSAVLLVALAPAQGAAGLTAADYPAVQKVFEARCVTCHSSHPTNAGFTVAPKGVMFDTQQEIVANARRAYEQVVVTRAMPLGNITAITDAERDLIGRWVRSGAPAP
ncbi:MAG: urate hydroxylase PuuD [Chloroflexota bacterium]|nr:urate hydroxylase PuuD [Chloroflexota bacterium]